MLHQDHVMITMIVPHSLHDSTKHMHYTALIVHGDASYRRSSWRSTRT